MMRRCWIPSLIFGLTACGLSGCLRGDVNPLSPVRAAKNGGDPGPTDPSAYHPHPPPPNNPPPTDPVQPAHYPDGAPSGAAAPSVKNDNAPPPLPIPPPPADTPTVQVEKAPQDPPIVTALRDLLQNRSPEALEQLAPTTD